MFEEMRVQAVCKGTLAWKFQMLSGVFQEVFQKIL